MKQPLRCPNCGYDKEICTKSALYDGEWVDGNLCPLCGFVGPKDWFIPKEAK